MVYFRTGRAGFED